MIPIPLYGRKKTQNIYSLTDALDRDYFDVIGIVISFKKEMAYLIVALFYFVD
ncbi:MAG: hypothetical protein WD512_02460 [Candidatus Paceibacterota bacterium]